MHAYAYAFMHVHTHISTSVAVTSLPVSLWISLQIFPVSGLVPVCCCSATSAPQLHDLSRALPQQHIQRAQALRELTALAAALCGPADSDTTCSRCYSVLLVKRLPILYLLCTISHRPWPICSLSDSFSQSSWHWHCYSWLTPHHSECAPVTLTPSVLRGFTCSWERFLIYLFFFLFLLSLHLWTSSGLASAVNFPGMWWAARPLYFNLEKGPPSNCIPLWVLSFKFLLLFRALLISLLLPFIIVHYFMGFPGGSDHKESACNAGNPGSIPGLGRSPGEGNSYLLQYSCLENSTGYSLWGCKESNTTEQLIHTHSFL